MNPVNNGPSPDQDFSTGKIPLTRRELRERERFLATQNQDLVPQSTYAVADIDSPEATSTQGDALYGMTEAGAASNGDRPQREELREMPAVTAGPPSMPEAVLEQAPAPELPEAPGELPAAPELPVASELLPEPELSVEPELLLEPELPVVPEDHLEPEYQPGSELHPEPELHPHGTHALPEHLAVPEHEAVPEHHEPRHAEPEEAPEPLVHPEHVYADAAATRVHHALQAHDGHVGHEAHYGYGDAGHEAHLQHDQYHPDEYLHHEDHVHHEENVLAGAAVAAPSKKVRRRRRALALLLTLGLFVGAIALGAQFLKPLLGMDKVADYPGPGTGSVTLTVKPGAGPRDVAVTLEKQGVVANSDTFLKELLSAKGEIAPGDFEFRSKMKNSDAVAVLLSHDASKVMYFALNAGLRVNESLEAIAKGSGIPLDQLNELNKAPGQFGIPAKAKTLEGFLAPGEYRFPLGTPAKDILQKLVNGTLDELKAQGVTDPDKQYDAVIVASIVQAEGGQADYGNVAGAIYNRLKPGNTETSGLIQSDATVTYGLGRKSFHITEEEKADKSNPYNTYATAGLPVGPIGSPGKAAIDAAAKPTPNDYMYWVTINLDTKETKFARTLAEHNVYVEQYNQWCGAHPGRCL